MQYVKVDLDGKAYTYGWTGAEPLKRGDRVEVPANVVNPEPSIRTILRPIPGPDYDVDKIVNILAKVEGGHAVTDRKRPDVVDPVIYDGEGNMSFPPTRRNLTAGLAEGDPSADAGDDRTFAEANPGVDLGRPEPHDWDDLI